MEAGLMERLLITNLIMIREEIITREIPGQIRRTEIIQHQITILLLLIRLQADHLLQLQADHLLRHIRLQVEVVLQAIQHRLAKMEGEAIAEEIMEVGAIEDSSFL